MPLLSRLFIKVAFAHLAAALGLGVAMAAARAGLLGGWVLALEPAWVHLLVVGWLTQLIFGVAFWLFPRHSREDPFGATGLAWSAFWLLNGGLFARVIAEPAVAMDAGGWAALLVASSLAQALGALAYVLYIWPRVRLK